MLGILGGMGPMATLDFVAKVVRHTPAKRDQDHIPMVVALAADIPDRTEAILGNGPDPFPAMLAALRQLEVAGTECVAIPCNTAHYWHAALQAKTAIPILHIVDAVIDRLPPRESGRIGILATTGTLRAGIYQRPLIGRGIDWLAPDDDQQRQVMDAIALVKGGFIAPATALLARQANALLDAGCRYVVMGCTEIPIALADVDDGMKAALIDATEALAVASVKAASDLCRRQVSAIVA